MSVSVTVLPVAIELVAPFRTSSVPDNSMSPLRTSFAPLLPTLIAFAPLVNTPPDLMLIPSPITSEVVKIWLPSVMLVAVSIWKPLRLAPVVRSDVASNWSTVIPPAAAPAMSIAPAPPAEPTAPAESL